MKQTTATRRAASVFHRTIARDPFSIEESTTEDRARRDIERLEWTGKGGRRSVHLPGTGLIGLRSKPKKQGIRLQKYFPY